MLRAWLESMNENVLRVQAYMNPPAYSVLRRRRAVLAVELLESRITPSQLTVFPANLPNGTAGQSNHGTFDAASSLTASRLTARTVSPAVASKFIVSAPTTASAGIGFNVTLTAKDALGNTVTGFHGGVTLKSSDGQTVHLSAKPTFTNGRALLNVTLDKAGAVTLAAASGTIKGTSGKIIVGARAVTGDWFSQNMSDPGLQALARTDFTRDGSLTYSDMLNLFAKAESAGSLTSAELQSLQALVTTSGATADRMATSVRSLTYKVVDGDPANAIYQGRSLGNLSVGSSPIKLQDLVGKWFLGEDHPTIDMQYLGGSSVSYALAGGTLFGSGGPSYKDVYQGEEGDCWLLASFAVTAANDASIIQSMFTDDGTTLENGVQVHVWTVRFYDNGVASYLTVDNNVPSGSGNFVFAGGFQSISNSSNVLWVPLAEKAYAQLCESGWNGRPQSNAYASLDAGNASTALPVITGAQQSSSDPYASASSFISAISSGKLLTLGSYSGDNSLGIVADHDYSVLGYNASNQTFTLLNPWGWNSSSAPGVLHLTWAQLSQNFYLDGNGSRPSSAALAAPSATTFESASLPQTRSDPSPSDGSPDPTEAIFTNLVGEMGPGTLKGSKVVSFG